ncbi:hypothetical protein F4804DRAFT_318345 [Jackrogersella minutella]|nr:hypothetical protein F4804DRAFT_318345 [Jackrogersella minutella]
MSISSGVGHFVQSIIETFQGLLAAIVNFFQWVVNSIIGLFMAFIHSIEGVIGFAISNFFVLGTVAAAVFAYLLYAQRQGTTPVSRTIKGR